MREHFQYYGFDLGFLMTSAFFSELDSRNLALGIRFEPVLGGLSRLKEKACNTSMQMVRSNEKIIQYIVIV